LTTLTRVLAPFMPFLSEAIWQNLSGAALSGASVHHEAYPDKRALDAAELTLLSEVAIARSVVNLGHSVRAQSKVKVRQPLARARIVADTSARGVINSQADIIRDELNIKTIEFVEREDELVSYKILPDLKKLGKKLGQDLPKVKDGLAALAAAVVAAAVKAGENIAVAGHLLAPDDVIVQAQPKEGLVVAGEAGIVVALDTVLTPALIEEGMAREVVRRINDGRKAAGLNISDRIHVRYQASEKLAIAIENFKDYIQSETLSVDLTLGTLNDAHISTDEFDGEKLTIALIRKP
jgi:isoleucyl-tRNA synthetase